MQKIFYFFSLILVSSLLANMGPQGFHEYPNEFFVETGTFQGGGIYKALQAGYKNIISIDIDSDVVNSIGNIYSSFDQVKVVQGDTRKDLWPIIKEINVPITFWLDAHAYPAIEYGKNCPVLEELNQIKMHPIKTHTILIDDMHCAGSLLFDFITINDLVNKIKEINPDYQISFVVGGDTGAHPNNILVAQIR